LCFQDNKNLTSSQKSTGPSVRNSSKSKPKGPVFNNAKNNGATKKNSPITNFDSKTIIQLKGKSYLPTDRKNLNELMSKLSELQAALEEEKKERAKAERHVEEATGTIQ
jgi:hypothetical protein